MTVAFFLLLSAALVNNVRKFFVPSRAPGFVVDGLWVPTNIIKLFESVFS